MLPRQEAGIWSLGRDYITRAETKSSYAATKEAARHNEDQQSQRNKY